MFTPATLQYSQLSHVHTCYTAVQPTVTCSHLLHCSAANCQQPLHTARNFHCIYEPRNLGLQPSVITNFNITVFTLVTCSDKSGSDHKADGSLRTAHHIIPWSFKYCLLLCEVVDCTPQSSNSGVRQCIVLLSKRTFTLLHITSRYLTFLLPVREFLKFSKPNKRFALNIDSDVRDGFTDTSHSRISGLYCIWVHVCSTDVVKY